MSISRLGVIVFIFSLFIFQNSLAGQYIPLKTGDYTIYRSSVLSNEVKMEVDRQVGVWRHFTNFASFGPSWLYATDSTEKVYLYSPGTITYQLFVDFNWPVGTSLPIKISPCNYGDLSLVEKDTTLRVPAGYFSSVSRLQLQNSCADAGVTEIWFAKDIGILQWTESNIAGLITYSLAEASIGGIIYPQYVDYNIGIKAKFPDPVISIDPLNTDNTQASAVLVGLTLENNLSRDLLLEFSTSQHFDIVLKDQNGVIVSSWSRGKAFLMATETQNIPVGSSFNVEGKVELTDDLGYLLPDGDYILEIFLMANNTPKLSQPLAIHYVFP